MIKEFENLTKEEKEFMLMIPAFITIMIAGIDDEEPEAAQLRHAKFITDLKETKSRPALRAYYIEVKNVFSQHLETLKNQLPKNPDERLEVISTELSKLNAIYPRLPKLYAEQFHGSMRNFAKQLAEISGGFIGFYTISYEEKELIALPMVTDPVTL